MGTTDAQPLNAQHGHYADAIRQEDDAVRQLGGRETSSDLFLPRMDARCSREADHVQPSDAHLHHPHADTTRIRTPPIRQQAPRSGRSSVQVARRISGDDELWKQTTHVMSYFKEENFRG